MKLAKGQVWALNTLDGQRSVLIVYVSPQKTYFKYHDLITMGWAKETIWLETITFRKRAWFLREDLVKPKPSRTKEKGL